MVRADPAVPHHTLAIAVINTQICTLQKSNAKGEQITQNGGSGARLGVAVGKDDTGPE